MMALLLWYSELLTKLYYTQSFECILMLVFSAELSPPGSSVGRIFSLSDGVVATEHISHNNLFQRATSWLQLCQDETSLATCHRSQTQRIVTPGRRCVVALKANAIATPA